MNSARARIFGWLRPARATLIWPALIACMSAGSAAAQSVWELTPYEIQLIPAAGSAPELTPALEEDLSADLLSRIDSVVGAPWDVTLATPPPPLRRAMIADIDSVAVDALPEDSLQFDKVMLLAVLPATTGYQVVACELDVQTRTWNTPVRVTAWQAAKLRDAAFLAVREAFAPLGQVASVDDDKKLVTLRLRAAGLPPRDKAFVPATPGDLFQPVVRHEDREGKLKGIVPIPWTFLRVRRVVQAAVECSLHTGLRSPLSGRRRGRWEQLALAVVPPDRSTRLTLTSRADSEKLLAGYDIYVQSPESAATELLGRTDRTGSVIIRPGEDPLRLLLVRHGGMLLARLPTVPGMLEWPKLKQKEPITSWRVARSPISLGKEDKEEQLYAEIPNDDQRLAAEGFILGLQEDLVDLVTRREVLVAQARARLKAKKVDEADTLIRQLQQLKTRDEFARELDQQKDKIYSDDDMIQRQIDSMFDNTQKLLKEYLDPKVIEELGDELARARAARDEAGS